MATITTRADAIKNQYSEMRNQRGTWDGLWREVAQLCYSEYDDFWQTFANSSHGEKKNLKIFDTTAQDSLGKFASVMGSILIPRNERWHTLRATQQDLNDDRDVQLYFEQVTEILFEHRYAPNSNFQSQMHQSFMSLGAFGNGPVFVDEDIGQGLRYKALFVGDSYFDVNHQGIIDTMFRRFDFSNQQATQRWGNKAPTKVKKEFQDKPLARHEYLHVVRPNLDFGKSSLDFISQPFTSIYIYLEDSEEIEVGGFRTFPFPTSRYETSPHEIYGRGPAMKVLPDINTLNDMAKTDLEISHLAARPPLLLHDDGILGAGLNDPDLRPGGLNYGGVNQDGRQMIQPLVSGVNPDLNERKMDVKRAAIKTAFLVDLFQILILETKRMTATETLLKDQEKAALLGPVAARIESEQIAPMIEREIEILHRAGELPPVPQKLIDAGGQFDIVSQSPIAKVQRAGETAGIRQTIDAAASLAQFDQSVIGMIDAKEAMRIIARNAGAPITIIKTDDQIAAQQQAQAEAQQQQQLATEAPALAGAAKDLAQAQQIAQGA